LHELALKRRIDHHKKDQNRLARQQQLTNERAQKRAQQAVAQRKTASQPKILLDAKKDSASHSLSSLKTQQSRQKTENQRALEELKKNYEAVKPQSIYLHDVQAQKQSLQKQPLVLKASKVLKVSKVSFDWLKNKPVSFDIFRQQHLRLYGANGSGKSTLLKAIHGESRCFSGHIIRNCETVYLDQHFNLLASVSNSNMLACLSDSCPGLSEQQARTLLAGIGFRRQAVYQQVCDLSGGEKMKLAMLMVSHMAETPLLLLDEPDNHLDIESKQLLAQALSQYRGTFLLVSHDEDFVVETRVAEQLIL
jgi:ATPase subunit of ABC transporter with duplicated ATPase domains